MKNSMKSTWELHNFLRIKVKKFYIFITTLYISGGIWLGMNLSSGNVFHLFCPWKKTTGIPCPACGLTTGTVETIHGNLLAGFNSHPLSFLVVLLFILIPVWLLYDLIFRKKSFFDAFQSFELLLKKNKIVLILVIILFIIIWVKNIVQFLS